MSVSGFGFSGVPGSRPAVRGPGGARRRGLPVLAAALLAVAALLSALLPAHAASDILSGRVFYRERILLPPSAQVEVRLIDVSRADARAITLARTRFAAEQRNPAPFVIRFDRARILPGHSYAVAAQITDGKRVLFRSTQRYPVLAGGATGPVDILVVKMDGDGPRGEVPDRQPASPAGRWLAEDIRGGGVIDRAQSTLELTADGQVSGSGGCNRFAGRATINGADILFSPMATTRMACPPTVMGQEARFLSALEEARGWRIDAARRKLLLLAPGGAPLLTFSPM